MKLYQARKTIKPEFRCQQKKEKIWQHHSKVNKNKKAYLEKKLSAFQKR